VNRQKKTGVGKKKVMRSFSSSRSGPDFETRGLGMKLRKGEREIFEAWGRGGKGGGRNFGTKIFLASTIEKR